MQYPPLYSAIKIQGQAAYKRARAGEAFELQPRPIIIYSLEVLEWISPRLTLAIDCSKGTYIRSLAHDLGLQVGCFAHLETLVRTRSGPFTLSNSITLEQFAAGVETSHIQHYAFPLDKALEQYPAIQLDAETVVRIKHGSTFATAAANNSGQARVYDNDGAFIAIAEWNKEQQAWQPQKVFASD